MKKEELNDINEYIKSVTSLAEWLKVLSLLATGTKDKKVLAFARRAFQSGPEKKEPAIGK
jgi:hypothetical protein